MLLRLRLLCLCPLVDIPILPIGDEEGVELLLSKSLGDAAKQHTLGEKAEAKRVVAFLEPLINRPRVPVLVGGDVRLRTGRGPVGTDSALVAASIALVGRGGGRAHQLPPKASIAN